MVKFKFKVLVFIILTFFISLYPEIERNIEKLIYFIKTNDTKELNLILEKVDIDLRLDDSNNNALYYAIKNNNIEIVEILIKNNIDINHKNKYGKTALHLVSIHGYYNIAELLLKNGSDVNLIDNCLFSPLHYAAAYDQDNIVDLLIKNGASITCACHLNLTELDCALQNHSTKSIPLIKLIVDLEDIIDQDYSYLSIIYDYIHKTLTLLCLQKYDYRYSLIKNSLYKFDQINKLNIILEYLDKNKNFFKDFPEDIKPKILLLIDFNKKLNNFSNLSKQEVKECLNNKKLIYRLNKWNLKNYLKNLESSE